MLLKIGGPFLGYYNGQIIDVDDAKGAEIVRKLGANSGRVEILGDLRSQPAPAAPEDIPAPRQSRREEREAAEEAALLAEIANEEAAAAAATATDS